MLHDPKVSSIPLSLLFCKDVPDLQLSAADVPSLFVDDLYHFFDNWVPVLKFCGENFQSIVHLVTLF